MEDSIWSADTAKAVDFVNQRAMVHLQWHKTTSIWSSGHNSVLTFPHFEEPSCCRYKPCVYVNTTQRGLIGLANNGWMDSVLKEIEMEDPLNPAAEEVEWRSISPSSMSSEESSGYASRTGSTAPPSTPGSSRRPSANEASPPPNMSSPPQPEVLAQRLLALEQNDQAADQEATKENEDVMNKVEGQDAHLFEQARYYNENARKSTFGSGRFIRAPVFKSLK